MQKFVESIEFSDQLHELFQDGERPREGLSARQKQQASSGLRCGSHATVARHNRCLGQSACSVACT